MEAALLRGWQDHQSKRTILVSVTTSFSKHRISDEAGAALLFVVKKHHLKFNLHLDNASTCPPLIRELLALDCINRITISRIICQQVAQLTRHWHAQHPNDRELELMLSTEQRADWDVKAFQTLHPTTLTWIVSGPGNDELMMSVLRALPCLERLKYLTGSTRANPRDADPIDLAPALAQIKDLTIQTPVHLQDGHLRRLTIQLNQNQRAPWHASKLGVQCDEVDCISGQALAECVPLHQLVKFQATSLTAPVDQFVGRMEAQYLPTVRALTLTPLLHDASPDIVVEGIKQGILGCPNVALLQCLTPDGVEVGYGTTLALRRPCLAEAEYLFKKEAAAMGRLVLLAYALHQLGRVILEPAAPYMMQAMLLFEHDVLVQHVDAWRSTQPQAAN